jgi:hypothetical protein
LGWAKGREIATSWEAFLLTVMLVMVNKIILTCRFAIDSAVSERQLRL